MNKIFAFLLGVSFSFSPSVLALDGASNRAIVEGGTRPLPKRIAPKVLIVTTFEVGATTGDKPGEAQYWIERRHLTRKFRVPGAFSPLYCNASDECLVITGMATSNAATSMMAVGLAPQIDLRKTYVLVAGIAGGRPDMTTLGAATWAEWAIDMDLSHHIDAREMPKSWDYANFHLGCGEPWCKPGWSTGTEAYQFNGALAKWAHKLTVDTELADSEAAKAYRKRYTETAAQEKAKVILCDTVSGAYYHGKIMSEWAKWWAGQWTDGKAKLCSSAMEETGLMTAIHRIASAKRIDPARVMVLRTIANFDQGYPGQSPAESLRTETGGVDLAIENAYRVGAKVVDSLTAHWAEVEKRIPGR